MHLTTITLSKIEQHIKTIAINNWTESCFLRASLVEESVLTLTRSLGRNGTVKQATKNCNIAVKQIDW